jgi:hypothetical protein
MCAVGLLLVSGSSAFAQAPPPSVAMTMTMTTDSGTVRHKFTSRFFAQGTKTRVEISTDSKSAADGTYMVYDSKDSTILSVMPSAKVATLMKVPSVHYEPDFPTVTSSDVTRDEVLDLGPSEPLLGFSTHRYRYKRASTTTITYADRACTQTRTSSEEVWLTTDFSADAISKAVHTSMSFAGSIATKVASLVARADSLATNRPKGFALRTVTSDTVVYPTGGPAPTSFVTEYTELSRAPLDSMLFAAPSGFNVMDMRGITISGDMSKIFAKSIKAPEPGCTAKF